MEEVPAGEQPEIIVIYIPRQADTANLPTKGRESVLHHVQEEIQVQSKHEVARENLTASSAETARSLSVPGAKTPPPPSFPSVLRGFFVLNLYVPRALIASEVAPLFSFRSSRKPIKEIMQGRQQHISAQRMKGIA
jgi:hypothetical protein